MELRHAGKVLSLVSRLPTLDRAIVSSRDKVLSAHFSRKRAVLLSGECVKLQVDRRWHGVEYCERICLRDRDNGHQGC